MVPHSPEGMIVRVREPFSAFTRITPKIQRQPKKFSSSKKMGGKRSWSMLQLSEYWTQLPARLQLFAPAFLSKRENCYLREAIDVAVGNGVRNHSTPVIPAVTRAQSRHAIGKRVLEPGTPLAAPKQTLTSTPSCLRVFVRGQISNQPLTKTRRHKERCKGEEVLLG